ncbi:MAG: ABC transporter permease [Lewinellaceae bacterium]|nr:ABC transporter permease [Phaeodactylibacter sp.]MCB9040726.1 ABC transporter permease [Lewinellaceae bacterium]
MAVWLSLAGTAANVLLFLGLHLAGGQVVGGFTASGWEHYIANHYEGIAFMMLPLYVIILCSLVFLMEHRQEMWVQLYTLPIHPRQVYLGKLAFLFLLFLGAHLLFIAGMLLSGLLFGILRPESGLLEGLPPLGLIAELSARTLLSILGLMGLHAWLSLRFRAFIVPLLIGILGYVMAGLLGAGWPWQFLNPYAPTFLFMPRYNGEHVGTQLGWLSAAELMSIAYLGLFTAIAFRALGKKGTGNN